MTDEERRDPPPVLSRQRAHEVLGNFVRILLPRESKPLCQTQHMRIHRDVRILPEDDRENDRGGFPSDAGEQCEFFHRPGHLPAMLREENTTELLNIFRLHSECPAGVHVSLKLASGHSQIVLRRAIFFEERRTDLIHPLIGALGGEERDDEEVERGTEVEEGLWGVVERTQLLENPRKWYSFDHESSVLSASL